MSIVSILALPHPGWMSLHSRPTEPIPGCVSRDPGQRSRAKADFRVCQACEAKEGHNR